MACTRASLAWPGKSPTTRSTRSAPGGGPEGDLSPPGQLVAAVTMGRESVLFGLGVLEDFRKCDHYASGGVLDGSGDQGARLCGGGAGRSLVVEVQVQQPVGRGRAAVFLGPDLRRLQPGQAGELAR